MIGQPFVGECFLWNGDEKLPFSECYCIAKSLIDVLLTPAGRDGGSSPVSWQLASPKVGI